ncbi:MAG TPA: hypothetical protein VKA10_04560, partial [Prolixibacteraceae bacterium]|nr:hypothetical protein [Prolixibacteraceae bacterium]
LLPLNRRWNTVLKDEVYFYNEGPAASVAVTKYRERNAALSINGAITAYTLTNDVRVHKMLGILPWLLNDEPENALVVGLGIGITAKTLDMAEVKNISVAELSPGVIQASKEIFGTTYRNNKSLKIYPEDGRAHLFRNKESYDLITTNAVHPRLGNVIYTRDFYQLCFDRLSEQGTMCQWIPTN